ncbi:MAG: ATP-binding protein [Clostridium sp.]|nr:ATP-binding protein [Bacteroides sp.]MCM1198263.1 ATP-binding protein [Clostridium sp.]
MYYERIIDKYLQGWAQAKDHKPLLLRGARQVGKSRAVQHLGQSFKNYVEINFEKQPSYRTLFQGELDVHRICVQIAAMCGIPIIPGETLLFFDEIQDCHEAILSLRFFREDYPELHVAAAGSLLEFALDELPTFGVGRIHSMFMFPMTFDEFLSADGLGALGELKNHSGPENPLPELLHDRLVEQVRIYMMVGGMPEVVAKWVESHDYIACQQLQDDLIISYEDDFPKYRKRVDPSLLRLTWRSAAVQVTGKFVCSRVGENLRTEKVQDALRLLTRAGLLIPVTNTSGSGLPLGSGADESFRKYLLIDSGILLRLLNMTLGNATEIAGQILTSDACELVNKGPLAEMMAGLEMMRYKSPNLRHEMFYWQRRDKNSIAEVDYLDIRNGTVYPIEVKAGTQGGMKSLWMFMRLHSIESAARVSLENFGHFDYADSAADGALRHVSVYPLYAIRNLVSE